MDLENHLYTIDADKTLTQLTNNSSYWEFDCAWNEDATKITMGRVPEQELPLTIPSQIWIMNSDGSGIEKITNSSPNPENEEPSRGYPIGVDADPDFSPDSKKIVFSRLKTGKINGQFGVWELVTVDIESKEVQVLDSNYANMIPVWSENGILVVRQIYDSEDPASSTQGVVLYKDGEFTELEEYPYNVFPIGAQSVSWIS
jgi:Tol biopolymer transport system component